MADPLSIAAGVVALIDAANRVIRASEHCIRTIKDAPKDMQMIMGEAMSLKAIIESISEDFRVDTLKAIPNLLDKTGPFEACRQCLSTLESLLPTEDPGNKRDLTLSRLKWPLKEPKARRALAGIAQHKVTLLLAMATDTKQDVKDIKGGVQKIEQAMSASQRQQIIQWLQRKIANPSLVHNEACRKHEKHTSAWLLRSKEWCDWLQLDIPMRLLWIHGIPGAGKTVLASFIVEQLKALCDGDNEVCYAYYYCSYSHNRDSSPSSGLRDGTSPRDEIGLLRWIVGQLCRRAKCVPSPLKELYDMGYDPSAEDLLEVLEAILQNFRVCYLIIDAVDESSPRKELLDRIATLAGDDRFQRMRVVATSRPYPDIYEVFSRTSIAISMSNDLVSEDIRKFVRSRLASSRRLRSLVGSLPEIEECLVVRANGMFRWAECQLYAMEKLRSEKQIQDAMRDLPKDLAESYIRILERIPDADRLFVRRVLVWICGHDGAAWLSGQGINANVLLSAVNYELYGASCDAPTYGLDDLQELCDCLVSTSGAPTDRDPWDLVLTREDEPPTPDPKTVDEPDCSTSGANYLFVSLAHYTVKEFLDSNLILTTPVSYFALWTPESQKDFRLSALRQALTADPAGRSADWVTDREAYCLTITSGSCHVYEFGDQPEIQDLFIQYFNPAKPHFPRIRAIQERIIRVGGEALNYYVRKLAVEVREIEDSPASETRGQAGTLLNLLASRLHCLVGRFIAGKDVEKLCSTKLAVTYIAENPARDARNLTYEGTISERQEWESFILGVMREE